MWTLQDWLQNLPAWKKRPEWLTIAGVRTAFVLTFCVSGALLPDWLPFVLIGASLVLLAVVVALPDCPRLALLWRRLTPPHDAPRVVDWSRIVCSIVLCFVCLGLTVVFLARGEQLGPQAQPTNMGLTNFGGLVFAWSFAFAAVESIGVRAITLMKDRRHDPAREFPARVWIDTDPSLPLSLIARTKLERIGMRAVFRKDRRKTDVELVLDDERAEEWSPFQPWPLRLRTSDLDRPEIVRAIVRREEILCRRHLLRGLEKLMKVAASRSFEAGTGYWVCPHHWNFSGLQRDMDEFDRWSIGPPFRAVLPLRSRVHLHRVLEALEIDLVFVEDGISFRRFKRVLGVLFETYDVYGGRRRVEDFHFVGLPGVRVILHEHNLEEPFRSSRYPEPAYVDIGRARILHVFKDRGEEEDDVIVPHVSDLIPDFAPVLL